MEYQHKAAGLIENGSRVIVADQSVAVAIRYKGSQPSATVTVVSATSMTLKHGAAGSETGDTTVGSSGVLAFATYTTLGALVDEINRGGNWQAEIVDGLRSDATTGSTLLARSETTITPKTQVLDCYWDTSAKLSLDVAISSRRSNFNKTRKGKVAVFQQARCLVDISSGTLTLYIYDVDKARSKATLLATFNGTDNVELSALIAGGNGVLRSSVGNDLLVRYVGSANLPDTGAYLNVAGYIEA
jgi:hypothetical protein